MKTLVIFIAILLVSSVAYIIVSFFFSLQTIEVIGANVQIVIDEKKMSKNLLFFPSDRVRKEIIADNTLLSDVRFQKKYPHTLVIVPVLRPAFARLRSVERVVLLDRDGVVLMDGDQGLALPIIQFNLTDIRVGETITEKRVQTALALLNGLQKMFTILSISEFDGSSLLVKAGKTDIFIAQERDVGEILATLQTLITGFRIKGTLPAVVDLRFDKPVIKF